MTRSCTCRRRRTCCGWRRGGGARDWGGGGYGGWGWGGGGGAVGVVLNGGGGGLRGLGALGGLRQLSQAAGEGKGVLSWLLSWSCFAAGTPMRTPTGSVAIEALRPGD